MTHLRRLSRTVQLLALPALALTLLGCPDNSSQPATPAPAETPATPAAPLVQKKEAADWCPEHGVPESICSRCNESLVAGFKEKGDWCKQHGLPDSQCFTCHPELEAEFLKKKPANAGGESTEHSEGDGHDH